jgi:hypothetical protein
MLWRAARALGVTEQPPARAQHGAAQPPAATSSAHMGCDDSYCPCPALDLQQSAHRRKSEHTACIIITRWHRQPHAAFGGRSGSRSDRPIGDPWIRLCSKRAGHAACSRVAARVNPQAPQPTAAPGTAGRSTLVPTVARCSSPTTSRSPVVIAYLDEHFRASAAARPPTPRTAASPWHNRRNSRGQPRGC